jgi:F420H(2)-dependent quinone reductase
MATASTTRRLQTRLSALFTGAHVALYRRTGGNMGGTMSGMPILLLTTTGRKSGRQRTTPVMYLKDGPAYVITASNGGSDHPPAWWLNLQNHPSATIQVGSQILAVEATQAGAEEKRRLWATLVGRAPRFEGYQKRTQREIPMVLLRPVTEP